MSSVLLQIHSELFDGSGSQIYKTAHGHIKEVHSVTVDGVLIPAAADCFSPGYSFNSRYVYLNSYVFRKGISNVEVVYLSRTEQP